MVSKILAKDDNNAYSILTYFDFDEELNEEMILNYLNEIIKKNPILKQNFIEKNEQYVLCYIETFDINKCLTIEYTKKSNFNVYINSLLNRDFTEYKFYMFLCIDKDQKKSRLYFKIHHAYVDGYKLIDMLTEPMFKKQEDNKLPAFKRKTDFLSSIYYWIIGTITLIIANIMIFYKFIFFPKHKNTDNNDNNNNDKKSTDFIICKSFSFSEIKKFVEKRNMSVNDFLYALMIKTDKIYTQKTNLLQTISSINVSKLNELNNLCPIFNTIDNSVDNNTLFKNIHNTFNNYKYSLFIPFLSIIMNNIITHLKISKLAGYYEQIIDNSDYMYSNIIGPPVDKLTVKITDIKFVTTAKNKAIVYNIISCKNNVNVICSFQKDIIKDKSLFKKCIYKAYNDLIATE